MKAVTYVGPSRLLVADKPAPRIEHPRDAVLRVTRAGICGSDLHLYHGLVLDTRVGATFGHEFTGVVEEVGPAVAGLRRGDRVLVAFNIACGECDFCRRELWAACERSNPNSRLLGAVYGYSHLTGGYEGGQAEYVRVPYADVGAMKIPDDLDDERVLLLTDVAPTGWQAAEQGAIEAGDTVVVFGCGPVGLMAQKSAWLQGAGRVIAVDRVAERLEAARRWAGAEAVNFAEVGDVVGHLREMTGGRGPDVAIDAVGLEASLVHAPPAGRGPAAGRPGDGAGLGHRRRAPGRSGLDHRRVRTALEPGAHRHRHEQGLTLRMGQCHVKRYLGRLLAHVRENRLDPAALITHRFPLAEAPRAYALFAAKEDGCIKSVLVPPAA